MKIVPLPSEQKEEMFNLKKIEIIFGRRWMLIKAMALILYIKCFQIICLYKLFNII